MFNLEARRKARWITAVFYFVSGVVTASWASRIPEIQQGLGLDDARWGGVLFAIPVGQVCGLPLSSWMVSRYGTRGIIGWSMVLFALNLWLLALAPSVWVLVPLLVLFGLCRNLVNISINTNSLEVQKLYDRPIVTTFHGLWSLACLVAAAAGTLMIARGVAPAGHFALSAALVTGASFLFKGKIHGTGPGAVERRPFFIAPDRYLFLLGLIAFCAMICEGTMFDWSVNYFRQVIKVDKEQVTFGYTSFIMAMTAGRLVGDKMIARFGPVAVLVANGILMAIGYSLAIFFPYLWSACAGFLVVGLGDSIVIPLVYMLATKTKKMPPAYAIASVTIIGYAGFLSGPLLVGSISKAFGMQWSFALVAVLALSISVLVLRVRKVQV
ncbi:MFS transporter [Paraflavisolibacter sp. H34]|uniref:MFS transporter n=1 Tax=Huijunlia imazamoxiresistens TaxID=3127457 RepID=UPI0030165D76